MNTLKEFTARPASPPLALLFLFSLALGLFARPAHARFNVEPYFKKYSGSFARGSSEGNITGESSGMNVGYIGDYFLAGLSFELGNFKYSKNVTDDGHTLFRGGGIGTYVGFHFFDRVKLWTGYLNSSIEPKSDDSFRYYGQQVSFGLGIRIWDFILLNYEIFNNYFTQMEDDVTGKTQGLETNIKTEKQAIGLSAFFIF